MRNEPPSAEASSFEPTRQTVVDPDVARAPFEEAVARRLEELRALYDLAQYLHRAKLPRGSGSPAR